MPPAERFDILVLGSGEVRPRLGDGDTAYALAGHEGMIGAPRIKSAQGVNRRPIWRCRYPDRCIPRSGRTLRWRPYASIGSDS
jgi:hypothetical protein